MSKQKQSVIVSDDKGEVSLDITDTGLSFAVEVMAGVDASVFRGRKHIRIQGIIRSRLRMFETPLGNPLHGYYAVADAEFKRVFEEVKEFGKSEFSEAFVDACVGLLLHYGKRNEARKLRNVSGVSAKLNRYVYFIQGETTRRVKIGVSDSPAYRLKQLQGSEKLVLLKQVAGDEGLEKRLHSRFEHLRLHGEWFEGADELLAYIETL